MPCNGDKFCLICDKYLYREAPLCLFSQPKNGFFRA